jgi:sugar phosphate isomerase/epimerase
VAHAIAGSPADVFTYIDLCGDRLANVHLSRAEGKRLHLPLDRSPDMAEVTAALRDHKYAGPLTLEIEDLNFGRTLTAEEKIAVLAADRAFLEQCFF